jgi:hypothetical protein
MLLRTRSLPRRSARYSVLATAALDMLDQSDLQGPPIPAKGFAGILDETPSLGTL